MLKLGSNCNGNFFRSLSLFQRFRLLYSTSSSSSCSIKEEGNDNGCLFTNFLVDSLGCSSQQSLATSAKLAKWGNRNSNKLGNFNFVEKAHFVIQFFEQLGFQQSDIRKIVCYGPRILTAKRAALKPKIDIILELGISGSDLVELSVNNPAILLQPLCPAIRALRVVLVSDDSFVCRLKRLNRISLSNIANYLIPNVNLWRDCCGVSSEKVKKYILQQLKPFTVRTDLFQDILNRVEHKLGIPRHSTMFMYGIQLLSFCDEKTFADRCALFKSFGWTQSDVLELTRRNPLCLTSSEARLKKQLDFLMNQLCYKSNDLAIQPAFFTYSLEKRLLPRHQVLQILKEKGLLQRYCSLYSAARLTESDFVTKFVIPFKEVHEVYAQLTSSTVSSLDVRRGFNRLDN